nr:hypothetical protein [uncultured Albidiferax sp.]
MTSVELLEKFNTTPQDTANVRRAGEILAPQLELFVEQWYVWLRQQPGYLQFFPDTSVANPLTKITKATRLMGCGSIISGVSPSIARTMVELGVSIGEVRTTATLRDAFELALRAIGVMDMAAPASTIAVRPRTSH